MAVLTVHLLGIPGGNLSRAGSVISYNISVNTSTVSGQSGYLDFQFNPGNSNAKRATATITNFQAVGGSLASSVDIAGDVTGLLPGTLTFDNGTVFNDIFQGITFGSSFRYSLQLSGLAIDSPGGTIGTTFALSLYAADAITPLLTADPNGSVLNVNLASNGTTSTVAFPPSLSGGSPVVTATSTAAVPEPSSLSVVISGLPVGLLVLCRLLSNRRHGRFTPD